MKDYATAMIHLPIYFDQKFSLPQYGCLLGVKSGHHNVDIGMNKLVQLKIMKESFDNQGSTVYGLADTLRIHIQYNEDDSIKDELNRLFMEGKRSVQNKNDQEE